MRSVLSIGPREPPYPAEVAGKVYPYTEVSGDWGGAGRQGSIADLRERLSEAPAALQGVPSDQAAELPVLPNPASPTHAGFAALLQELK